MEISIGDIVWAKVDGYPEWPAVVAQIEGSNATVHFIGDKTHAIYEKEKLKKFADAVPEKKKRWLELSYRAAKKLVTPVDLETLVKVNENIMKKMQKAKKRPREPSTQPPNISLNEKIANLHRLLDMKIYAPREENESKKHKAGGLVKKAEILNSFTISKICQSDSPKYTIEDIIMTFDKILSLDISLTLFHSTKIIRTLKLFRNFLEMSPDADVRKLVRISEKILNHWNKLIVLSEIVNAEDSGIEKREEKINLRQNLIDNLAQKGFIGITALNYSKKIEKALKEVYTNEDSDFMSKYRSVIKEVKEMPSDSVDSMITRIKGGGRNALL
ncbi:hypothetical protein SteCoe_14586 [Stentor coeruleus]|uniref:PWWP domain-containing protein n=1 Tax=Stentor coeruleus TaxID=5963 RepID=A0A1R2C5L6_9CILI|nr:hypothetical protein SteCoe_14586 [Stentor coeruleus]